MRYRIYSTSGVPYFSRSKLVPYFPVLHIPPLQFGAAYSGPAYSSPAFSMVPHFPVLHFQSPPWNTSIGAAETKEGWDVLTDDRTKTSLSCSWRTYRISVILSVQCSKQSDSDQKQRTTDGQETSWHSRVHGIRLWFDCTGSSLRLQPKNNVDETPTGEYDSGATWFKIDSVTARNDPPTSQARVDVTSRRHDWCRADVTIICPTVAASLLFDFRASSKTDLYRRGTMHKRGICCHEMSVCSSVRLSRRGIVSKRLRLSSKFFYYLIATTFYISVIGVTKTQLNHS